MKGRPVSDAFSWRSPSVRALALEGKRLTDEELLAWMLRDPRLIRRPIIVVQGKLFFGFRPAELEAYLGRAGQRVVHRRSE